MAFNKQEFFCKIETKICTNFNCLNALEIIDYCPSADSTRSLFHAETYYLNGGSKVTVNGHVKTIHGCEKNNERLI
jgi:hypothetical protein